MPGAQKKKSSGKSDIAVIGMACWYPGAQTVLQLWENILSRRQQFRRLSDFRLPMADYHDFDRSAPDKTYGRFSSYIDGFEFDWVTNRIPKSAFESTDLVHWLALDVALKAVHDAGYNRTNLPKEMTGVLVGNSLTGESTRSDGMRMRWPYVRRAIVAAAQTKGMSESELQELLATTEQYFKSVFAPVTEDTLAGALSNTIPGRICNFLDLGGGGYTVDGACSSSLIAIATAASSLVSGDIDMALAGGVDVSLDTFELIGFAKVGALAENEMRVYDREGKGFIPGEGSGFVVLKRMEDALRDGDKIYSVLKGWGISSDGSGGITAPKASGQSAALKKAYRKSGYSVAECNFIEGHGTGTAVGDKVELEGILKTFPPDTAHPARATGMTSLKSILGHTKAAAGVGAFIKTCVALNRRVLPPTAGCENPNPVFDTAGQVLYPILSGEVCEPTKIMRAGVSAMGFGGINCHVTLESYGAPSLKLNPGLSERALMVSHSEAEIFVFAEQSVAKLKSRLAKISTEVRDLPIGDLVDLSADLAKKTSADAPIRVAIIAKSPEDLLQKIEVVNGMLSTFVKDGAVVSDVKNKIWISNRPTKPKIGFLYPGQGSQKINMARELVERFDWAKAIAEQADHWLEARRGGPLTAGIFKIPERAKNREQTTEWERALAQTENAQPSICFASMLWTTRLRELGILPALAGGHSLGELTAVWLGGGLTDRELLELAQLRGHAMSNSDTEGGAMASLGCGKETAEELLDEGSFDVVVANINGPMQVVVSGHESLINDVIKAAGAKGISAQRLPVSNAFHSPLVKKGADRVRAEANIPRNLPMSDIKIFSSRDGRLITPDVDLRNHFSEQITSSVDFVELVRTMKKSCDLMIEVGPGGVLSALSNRIIEGETPTAWPVESQPGKQRDFLTVVAVAYSHGVDIRWEKYFQNRLVRPYDFARRMETIVNPCEKPFPNFVPKTVSAPVTKPAPASVPVVAVSAAPPVPTVVASGAPADIDISQRLNAIISKITGFAPDMLKPEMKLLDDLNLDSIKAGEIIAMTAKEIELTGDLDPTEFANASIGEIAKIMARQRAGAAKIVSAQPNTTFIAHLMQDVSQITSLPLESIHADLRLDADLRLSKAQIMALLRDTCVKRGLEPQFDVDALAGYTLDQLSKVMGVMKPLATPAPVASAINVMQLNGLGGWVRNFGVKVESAPRDPVHANIRHVDDWANSQALIVFDGERTPFIDAFETALRDKGSVVHCMNQSAAAVANLGPYSYILGVLPGDQTTLDGTTKIKKLISSVRMLVNPPRASSEPRRVTTVGFIQFGGGEFGLGNYAPELGQAGLTSLAATLHIERQDLRVRVIDASTGAEPARLANEIMLDLTTPQGYAAFGYDASLTRRVPNVFLQDPSRYKPRTIAWAKSDVVVVTGGAKGITFECAMAFAQKNGAQLALVGSSPASGVAENLSRLSQAGIRHKYYVCDVVNLEAVRSVIESVERDLGKVTGLIHGAGKNIPRRVGQVTEEAAFDEIAPKLVGAINFIEALGERPLKLLCAMTSIIGVTGVPGNAWYGYSNEALSLVLKKYQLNNPGTAVIAGAFSVWGEVGMAARLGTMDKYSKMGIGLIPVKEGVERFLHLLENDPGMVQVVVTSRLWAQSPISVKKPLPAASRFLEDVVYHVEGVETVAKVKLTLAKDLYLKDHCYNGSYLFPTVLGLEAMAQAAAYTLGLDSVESAIFEDIELASAIPVNAESGNEILVFAEAMEPDAKSGAVRVRVGVRSEQQAFKRDAFSAIVSFPARAPEVEQVPLDLPAPLALSPKADLYGPLLFHGPQYQRVEQFYRLDSKRAVFKSARQSKQAAGTASFASSLPSALLLGDPYHRDSLLQATQVVVPKDISLPLRCKRWEILDTGSADAHGYGFFQMTHETEKLKTGNIQSRDEKGRVLERLTDCQAIVLKRAPDNPTAEELADGHLRMVTQLQRELAPIASKRGMTMPKIAFKALTGLKDMKTPARHEAELPLIQSAIKLATSTENYDVQWADSGKPTLSGPGKPLGISVSHVGDDCLVTVGEGEVGCDFETVKARTETDWQGLLGAGRVSLLAQLTKVLGSHDHAGTHIWAALEAAKKASGDENAQLHFDGVHGKVVTFRCVANERSFSVLGLKLAWGAQAECVFAFAQIKASVAKPADKSDGELFSVEKQGESGGFTARWPVTFKDAANPGGTVYFTKFAEWQGRARELALWPVLGVATEYFSSGEYAWVTNDSETQIYGTASVGDLIQVEGLPQRVKGREDTSIDLHFTWSRVRDGQTEVIGHSRMGTTWVRVLGHGVVEPAPFPPEISAYFTLVDYPDSATEGSIPTVSLGAPLTIMSAPASMAKILASHTFDTATEDSNVVGNIYFSNYYVWQGRVRDGLMNGITAGHPGQLVCTKSSVKHLREVMPFDRVTVNATLKEVRERGLVLFFEYFRANEKGGLEKVAFGEHEAYWAVVDSSGKLMPTALPTELIYYVSQDLPVMTAVAAKKAA